MPSRSLFLHSDTPPEEVPGQAKAILLHIKTLFTKHDDIGAAEEACQDCTIHKSLDCLLDKLGGDVCSTAVDTLHSLLVPPISSLTLHHMEEVKLVGIRLTIKLAKASSSEALLTNGVGEMLLCNLSQLSAFPEYPNVVCQALSGSIELALKMYTSADEMEDCVVDRRVQALERIMRTSILEKALYCSGKTEILDSMAKAAADILEFIGLEGCKFVRGLVGLCVEEVAGMSLQARIALIKSLFRNCWTAMHPHVPLILLSMHDHMGSSECADVVAMCLAVRPESEFDIRLLGLLRPNKPEA